MAEFIKAANISEVPEGSGKIVVVNGKSIAVFRVGGQFYAIENACTHQGGPLGEGSLAGKTVMCPWHGWEFDVTSGACSSNPGSAVGRFDVKVEGGDLLIAA